MMSTTQVATRQSMSPISPPPTRPTAPAANAQQIPQAQVAQIRAGLSQHQQSLNPAVPATQPAVSAPLSSTAFRWSSLSDAERRACAGQKWTQKRCGLHAWDIVGQLRDHYESEIEPVISTLWRRNHSYIYEHLESTDRVWGQPCLLGHAEDDVTQAKPFTYIICDDVKKGRRAKRVLEKSARYSENSIGFRAIYEKRWFSWLGGSDTSISSESPGFDPFRSPCGSRLLLTRDPLSKDQNLGSATFGGVFFMAGHYYAVTALHCFLTDQLTSRSANVKDKDKDGKDGDIAQHGAFENESSNRNDDGDDDGVESMSSSQYSTSGDDDDQHSGDVLRQGEDQDFKAIPSDSIPPCWVYQTLGKVNAQDKFYPALVGCFDVGAPSSGGLVETKRASLELDYALIPLQDPRMMQQNNVQLTDKRMIEVVTVNNNGKRPPDRIIVAGGVSGARRVPISGTLSSLMSPWSSRILKVLTVATSFGKQTKLLMKDRLKAGFCEGDSRIKVVG